MIFLFFLAIIWNADEKYCCKSSFFVSQSVFSFYGYEQISKHKKILLRGVLQELYIPKIIFCLGSLFLHQYRHRFFEIIEAKLWEEIIEMKAEVTIWKSLESDLSLYLFLGNMNIHQFFYINSFGFAEEEDSKIEIIKK